jgi:hypothetical protein
MQANILNLVTEIRIIKQNIKSQSSNMNKILHSLSITAAFGGICYLVLPQELKHFINYAEIAIVLNLSYRCGEYSVYEAMFDEVNRRFGEKW